MRGNSQYLRVLKPRKWSVCTCVCVSESVHVYVYVCVQAYVRVCVCACACVWVYESVLCVSICVYMCACVTVYICEYTYMHVCQCAYVCVGAWEFMHVGVYMYTCVYDSVLTWVWVCSRKERRVCSRWTCFTTVAWRTKRSGQKNKENFKN